MADNYLEKKMEEHRLATATKSSTKRITPSKDRPGTLSIKFNPLRVLVTDGSTAERMAVVKRLSMAGCRIAFISKDVKQGRELSQSSGSRFYPSSEGRMNVWAVIEDLKSNWGGVDALILTGDESSNAISFDVPEECLRIIAVGKGATLPDCTLPAQATVNAIDTSGLDPADCAQFCLYLCLPSSGFISRQTFSFDIP